MSEKMWEFSYIYGTDWVIVMKNVRQIIT